MENEPIVDPRGHAELLPAPVSDAVVQLAPAAPRQAPGNKARYLAAVRRYKWLILAVVLVGSAASAAVTRFLHPKYVAEATIWVEVPSRDDARTGPVQSSELLASTGWLDLLHSYTVMDAVVRGQRLFLDYEPEDTRVFRTFTVAGRYHPGDYKLQVTPDRRGYVLTAIETHETPFFELCPVQ